MMKYYYTIICLIIFGLDCFSQLGLTLNYEDILEDEKLKRIKTMFYRSEDTTKSEGRVLFIKEFDIEGKLQLKYVYTFWDVVSYDHTTTYKYDNFGNLIEKTKMQKILNFGKRDEKYIKVFGDDPINEKWVYSYDSLNRLTKEVSYTFGEEKLDMSKEPGNTIEYFYNKNNQLIKEVSTTPNGVIIYQNYITTYKYDENGNKIEELKIFTTNSRKKIKSNDNISV